MATIKNDTEFYNAIDQIAEDAAKIDTLKAQQKEAEIALKKEWATKIEAISKPKDAVFKRVKKYAIDHRDRLLGDSKTAQTKVATWGFSDNPEKVIPIIKTTDAAMVEQLRSLSGDKGYEYLNTAYTLDKSKIRDALHAGVKWIAKIFQLTQDEQFSISKIKSETE